MSCSIENDTIQLHLDKTNTLLGLITDTKKKTALRKSLQNRLAQNPDISKMELEALLRRFKAPREDSRKTYWAAMMAQVSQSSANSNDKV